MEDAFSANNRILKKQIYLLKALYITYTMLKAPPTGIDKSSLLLGIVDLGEVRYTGQLEVEPNDIKLGMKLKAVWKKVRVINDKPVSGFVWIQP